MSLNIPEKIEELNVHLKNLASNEKDKYDFEIFKRYFEQFLSVPPTIDWSQMKPLESSDIVIDYAGLPEFSDEDARKILSRVAVIKLNGGLGTSMGCSGPKSLITVRDGKTFLDFVIDQNRILSERYNVKVPLFLMDSYKTEETTRLWLKERNLTHIRQFTQSKCPRIYKDTLMPVPQSPTDRLNDGWYPPGHGNVFAALQSSGLLDELLAEGRDVIFVSNIDNTAATVDVRIASVICRDDVDYVMETTEKTQQDIKGGTLIEYDGGIKHLELPHVPADKVDEFCSLRTFKTFNTNNIWVDLKAVKRKLPTMKLEVLPNMKKLSDGKEVIQLESAIGGAIRNFERVRVISVHRSRFLPVKKTQDLLVVMGNAFAVADGVLRLNSARATPTAPIVHLSPHFEAIGDFLQRFPYVPDMLDLESLTVRGDVHFEKGVKLENNVVINGDGIVPENAVIGSEYTIGSTAEN